MLVGALVIAKWDTARVPVTGGFIAGSQRPLLGAEEEQGCVSAHRGA